MKTWFEKGELAWQKYVCNALKKRIDFNEGEEPSLDIKTDPHDGVWEDEIVEDNGHRFNSLSDECKKKLIQGIQNVCNHNRMAGWICGCHRKIIDVNGNLNQIEYVLHTVNGIIFLSLSNLSYLSEGGYILASYTIRDSDENRNIINANGDVAFPCDDRGCALYDILHANSRTMTIERIVDDKYESFGIWNFVRHICDQMGSVQSSTEAEYEMKAERSGGRLYSVCGSSNKYYLEAYGFDCLQDVCFDGHFFICDKQNHSQIGYGCEGLNGKYMFKWYDNK